MRHLRGSGSLIGYRLRQRLDQLSKRRWESIIRLSALGNRQTAALLSMTPRRLLTTLLLVCLALSQTTWAWSVYLLPATDAALGDHHKLIGNQFRGGNSRQTLCNHFCDHCCHADSHATALPPMESAATELPSTEFISHPPHSVHSIVLSPLVPPPKVSSRLD